MKRFPNFLILLFIFCCHFGVSFAVDDVVEVEGEVIAPVKEEDEVIGPVDLDEQQPSPLNVTTPSEPYSGADQGNWTVDSCIIVKMAAQLTIKPDKKNENVTVVVEVPVSANVSDTSSCTASNTTQTITLQWTEGVFNRNLTLTFSKDVATNQYGVSKISAVYELKYVNHTNPQPGPDGNSTVNVTTTVLEYITISTFEIKPWEFLVPENRSYLCVDIGDKSMLAEKHWTDEHGGASGEKLFNSTITAKKVQFDAFRGPNTFPDEFQTPSDCSYRPNDVVPIIVGCALAGLVLMVLIAYLIGRRKSRARGYQSV